ncbi:AAA family ATPase [Bradyrhizobium sp. 157]|uniref:AAA family ATPase n=1 Tax=Bradyrhizobium sp. 157 TaxID=2782631 RepID=UPI001FF709C3|nr:AAA family ATPase [Bradyrhizobium sp. 157]MCK1639583.1 AAA family ATPase [Bradyrhizobium sp. 157]
MRALPLKFFDECANEPPKPWAVKGVLALNEDSSWFGPAGSLKSTLLTDLAVHLAAGKDWRGFKTKMQAGVVYFAFERAALTRRRLAAYAKRDGLATLPISVADQIVDLIDVSCVEIITETIKAAEARFGIPVGLIILDTYAKGVAAGGGDEDKAQHTNAVAANLKRIHEYVGQPLHIALIGHTGKDESRGERGSSAKTGHIDVGVQISGEGKVKTATVVKGNDQPEDALTAFEGEEIAIGFDADGDALTAFIVSPRTVQAAPEGASRLSDMQVLALDALKRAIAAHGTGGAVAVDIWREELFRSGVLDGEAKNPREPFRRLRNGLARLRRIVEQDGTVRIGYALGITPMASPSIVPPPPGGTVLLSPLPPLPVR